MSGDGVKHGDSEWCGNEKRVLNAFLDQNLASGGITDNHFFENSSDLAFGPLFFAILPENCQITGQVGAPDLG